MNILPERILKLMTPAERKKLGKAGRTMEDIGAEQAAKSESELQSQLKSLLALRHITFLSPRFGKASGILPGWPDITFAHHGIPCLWEVKIGKNDLQEVQAALRPILERNGWRYAVIRSLDEGRAFLNQIENQIP